VIKNKEEINFSMPNELTQRANAVFAAAQHIFRLSELAANRGGRP
jgi:hypothetical protein